MSLSYKESFYSRNKLCALHIIQYFEKYRKKRLVRRFQRFVDVFLLIFLFIVFSMSLMSDVHAERNDNGCNNGDKVTITLGQAGREAQTLKDITVGGNAIAGDLSSGGTYQIAIRCEDYEGEMKYAFFDVKFVNTKTGDTRTEAGPVVSLEEIKKNKQIMDSGSDEEMVVTHIDFGSDADDYVMWMSEVEQGEDTTNPETGVPDDAYDPAGSIDENKENGNIDDSGDTLSMEWNEGECPANSGAVSWIICPIIEGAASLGNWLWDEVETNFMQIDASRLFW